MKQPRTFLLFMEAILQLSPIVNGELIVLVVIVTISVVLDDVCRGVWQAVFCSVTTALTDPGILTVSPLVLPLMSILRIALKTKKLQQLTVLMVTELCYLYHQIPFKLSSEDMLVVSSLSDKVCCHGNILLLILCFTENVSMAILIRDNIALSNNITKDSNGHRGYCAQVFFCQWQNFDQ